MALDINGYNASFNAFVKFADDSMRTNGKAVARFGEGGAQPLGGRTIVAVDPKTDKVGKIGRSLEQKDFNNKVRTAFRNAIIDMFGGENNIPPSVKKAMLLSDYDKGKPLTARRIMAVKSAIDANGVMKQKGVEETMLQTALDKGYAKGEMPKLAKAANLLAQVKGCSVEQAFEEVSTPGSKANRLMNYGGRFMQSADNFKNGLRLIDSFDKWFDETNVALHKVHPNTLTAHFEEGMSKTLLNGWETMFTDAYKIPVERFVFEGFANDPAVNLAEKNTNKLFGMENNHAMSCIARDMMSGRTQTISQIPPEKRLTFFKALSTLNPLVSSAEEAQVPQPDRHAIKSRLLDAPVARILKNLDKLIELDSQKKLTAANLVKLCFPEIKEPSEDPVSDVVDLVDKWDDEMNTYGDECKYPEDGDSMTEAMKSTGCSVEEAEQIAKGKLQLPNVPYFSSGTLGLRDGPEAARNQLIGDLNRGIGYNYTGGPQLLKTTGFRFNLPGGESLFANKTEQFKGNIPVIADKLEALCGPTHKAQARSLLMMTCQSGLGLLLKGLKSYGVESTEHSSVDFTITKNNDTGDISIRYSSPKELPFAFEWTATIKPDGYISSTPIRFTDAETLQKDTAAATPVLTEAILLAGHQDKAAVDRIVASLIDKTRGDRELLSLLTAKDGAAARNIAMNGEMVLRSDEEITKRLEALRANVDELRTAAGGDKRVFDIAMGQLKRLGGKALPSGTITQIVELTAKADVSALKGLSAKSSASALTKAMCAMDRIVTDICGKTQVMKNFGFSMAAEGSTVNSMIMGLVFARMDARSLGGIKATFYSNTNVQVKAALDKLDNYEFPKGSHYDAKTKEAMHRMAHSLGWTFRVDFGEMLCDALGQAEADMLPDPEEEIEPDPDIVKAVTNLVEKQITEVHHDLLE